MKKAPFTSLNIVLKDACFAPSVASIRPDVTKLLWRRFSNLFHNSQIPLTGSHPNVTPAGCCKCNWVVMLFCSKYWWNNKRNGLFVTPWKQGKKRQTQEIHNSCCSSCSFTSALIHQLSRRCSHKCVFWWILMYSWGFSLEYLLTLLYSLLWVFACAFAGCLMWGVKGQRGRSGSIVLKGWRASSSVWPSATMTWFWLRMRRW